MHGAVLGEGDIPGGFAHFGDFGFLFEHYCIRFVLRGARRGVLPFLQEASVVLRDRVLLGRFGQWLANVVQRQVCPRPFRLSEVEVLLHAFVTNFVVLVVGVVEPVAGAGVPPLRLVRYRSFFVAGVMVRTWCLLILSDGHEVWLVSDSYSYLVNFVIIFSCLRAVLYWYLLVQFLLTCRQIKSFVLTLAVFENRELYVIWLRCVRGHRRRRSPLKVNRPLRKPR